MFVPYLGFGSGGGGGGGGSQGIGTQSAHALFHPGLTFFTPGLEKRTVQCIYGMFVEVFMCFSSCLGIGCVCVPGHV